MDTSNVLITLENDVIKVNGIAKLNLILQNKENNELESKSIDIMIDQNFTMDDSWKNSNIHIKIKDVKLNVTQNNSNIDIKIVIYVKVNVENILNISSIEAIEDLPINLNDISSINIYIVKPGDSIGKLQKNIRLVWII